jgi:hypothetical protein
VGSPYVDEEIAYFKSIGREDRILCVVAYGEPNATDLGRPALECFPRALRFKVTEDGEITDEPVPLSDRPIAADLTATDAKSRARALSMIVAAMSEVSLTELSGHARRRRILQLAAGVAALALVGGAAAVAWLGWFQPATTYSRDYVRKWGEWRPVDRVGGRGRTVDASYRFTRRGWFGRTLKVALVDRSGACPAAGISNVLGRTLSTRCGIRRACAVQMKYRADGSVIREEMLDQNGDVLETLSYTEPTVAQFTEAGIDCSRSLSGIKYVRFQRNTSGDQKGFDRRVEFLAPGPDGPTPRINDQGVAAIETEYDRKGRPLEVRRYGLDGGLAFLPNLGSRVTWTRDLRGHVTKELRFDQNGRPQTAQADQCHGWSYAHDLRGNVTVQTCLGPEGQPAFDSTGVSIRRFKHNGSGDPVETRYFDPEGRPTLDTGFAGSALVKRKFDRRGREVETAYFGADGRPAVSYAGFHRSVQTYDAAGRLARTELYGPGGERVAGDDWWWAATRIHGPGESFEE